jgi:lipopolysaccharide/colanic/teichoic acid biosynthesis glycosyltransferase
MNSDRGATPLIGRTGVRLVASDVLAGGVALPAAALLRDLLGAAGSALGTPAGTPSELGRPALWLSAAISLLLWPLAIRALDAAYPSLPLARRRLAIAGAIWLLGASGTIYLADKELASRALVLFAAAVVVVASALARAAVRVGDSTLIADAPRSELPQLGDAAERALQRGEPVAISVARLEGALARPTIVFEGGRIWIYPSALSPAERLVKRLLDVLLAGALLLLLSPIMLIVALAALLTQGRPVFYREERAGLFGRPFSLRKFRTMRVGADAERAALWAASATSGPAFKMSNDPRITPLGRLLRRFSIDELPQLWDVLSGRMSLIGPRPAGLDELARYEDRHRLRLTVRPGVTGLWQVRRRIDDDFEQRMGDDLEYIRRWSIVLDLQIAARTVRAVLAGRGL